MPLYSYIARDQKGNIKRGEIDLESEQKLARWLYNQGFLLTKFEEKGHKARFLNWDKIAASLGHISLMEKVLFTRYLQVMIKSGLSLVKALHILAQQTENRKFKKVIKELHHDVETGSSFFDALKNHPDVFSNLYVSVVKTGEVSGKLDKVLDQLATQLKKDRDLVKKVTGAMIYPALVIVVMLGIGFAMMTFVLPKLITIFEDFNTPLPLPTKILIAASKFMSQYFLWIIGGLAIFIFAFLRWMKSKSGRKILHKVYLKAPILSKIVKKLNLARFVRNLGSLLASGLPILQSLDIVSEALGNIYYTKAIKGAAKEVAKGHSLGKSLGKIHRLFPPVVTQVVEVGEETGSLDSILLRLADFYEEDVDQTMKNISTIIEPVLMLIMGGAVGGMAVSIILPIYTLTGSI